MTTLDDRLRGRLAEIRASAGVPHAQISLEVLYFLPKGFLDAYADLFTRALRADGGESGRNAAQQSAGALGKTKVTGSGGAKPARKWKKAWAVQDERLLRLKTRFDKRLRVMATEMAEEMALVLSGNGEEVKGGSSTAQCIGCKMFLQTGWRFCPTCGKDRDNR